METKYVFCEVRTDFEALPHLVVVAIKSVCSVRMSVMLQRTAVIIVTALKNSNIPHAQV
jgi:hypothetical protein